MYKLITCDLDDTLLTQSDSSVCEKNREAIKVFSSLGGKFVVATGRGYTTVQGTLDEIGLRDKENEYTISFNGGVIVENKNNRILSIVCLPFEKAQAIFNLGLQFDVGIRVYTEKIVYTYNIPQEEIDWMISRNIKTAIIPTTDISFLKDEPIIKMIYYNKNVDYLFSIEDEVRKAFPDIELAYSANKFMELNPLGVNKGEGLKRLCELLNIDIKDTIAIGDNYNDLSMIVAAGLGVGVSNTIESMKPLCNHITKTNCNEGAVSEVIHEFVLDK